MAYCPACGNAISETANFCRACEYDLKKEQVGQPQVKNTSENELRHIFSTTCQNCGRKGQTKYVAFYWNIGMLIVRQSGSIKGYLCKECAKSYFWSYTLTNLVGWFGVISLMVTPFYILNNFIYYIRTLKMEPPETWVNSKGTIKEAIQNDTKRHLITDVPERPKSIDASECPYCGKYTVGKAKGLQGGNEPLVFFLLFLLFFIPGIVYYIHIGNVPYCSSCEHRVRK